MIYCQKKGIEWLTKPVCFTLYDKMTPPNLTRRHKMIRHWCKSLMFALCFTSDLTYSPWRTGQTDLRWQRIGLDHWCTSLGVSSLLPNVESIACRSQTPAKGNMHSFEEKHDEGVWLWSNRKGASNFVLSMLRCGSDIWYSANCLSNKALTMLTAWTM